jgi:hypothetical protein
MAQNKGTFKDRNSWVVEHQLDSDAAMAKRWHSGVKVDRSSRLGLIEVDANDAEVGTIDSVLQSSGDKRYK